MVASSENVTQSATAAQVTETELRTRIREWLRTFPSDAPAVVIPVFNAYEDMLACVESLLANTPPGVPILTLDDASTDARISDALAKFVANRQFMYIRKPTNSGFVGTVNLAFAGCAPRDVVVVNSDVVVPSAWLERLRAAAYFRSTIATATPFTNRGSILSLPYRDSPVDDLVGGKTVEEVDIRVRKASLRIYPIIPTAVGHCTYFKRSALDAVGYFDQAFAPGYGEEVDFSQRAVMAGFSHVLADDLFVFHKGSRSFEGNGQEAKRRIQAAHEELVRERYPWYMLWSACAAKSDQGPLARAIERAQTALVGCRIAIDATCVGGPVTGTQVLTLELIRALATAPGRSAHLTVIVHDHIDRAALLGVDQLVDQVVTPADLQNSPQPCFSLVHRPFQVRTLNELIFLSKIAHRFVVSQLDFIAFANPSYAAGPQEWDRYRHLTQLICDTADGIVFISHDVAQDAAHQGMNVEAERARVIFLGVDHYHLTGAVPPSAAVADNSDSLEPPFILVLGTSFRHKNRVFALRLLQELIKTYHWNGKLVLAGPNVTYGGSEAEEELLLQRNPELRSQVVYLSAVNEPDRKLWLLKNASLVLYPSTCEGFGMIPFEAAAAGTPTLTTRTTSLAEVLGDQVMYLDVFDPQVGAQVVWSLLSSATVAAKQVTAIQARMANYTWSAAAAQTWDFYHQILALPPRSHERILQQALDWEPRLRLVAGVGALPGWRRRLALAFYIGFAEGLGPLFAEVRQYVRWLVRFRR